jgi:hypothetical protein
MSSMQAMWDSVVLRRRGEGRGSRRSGRRLLGPLEPEGDPGNNRVAMAPKGVREDDAPLVLEQLVTPLLRLDVGNENEDFRSAPQTLEVGEHWLDDRARSGTKHRKRHSGIPSSPLCLERSDALLLELHAHGDHLLA